MSVINAKIEKILFQNIDTVDNSNFDSPTAIARHTDSLQSSRLYKPNPPIHRAPSFQLTPSLGSSICPRTKLKSKHNTISTHKSLDTLLVSLCAKAFFLMPTRWVALATLGPTHVHWLWHRCHSLRHRLQCVIGLAKPVHEGLVDFRFGIQSNRLSMLCVSLGHLRHTVCLRQRFLNG